MIIPVFNAATSLREAVDSCLQLPEVGEVILMDDGSDDGSVHIGQSLAGKEERVRWYCHPGGVHLYSGASRNAGMLRAKFEFIAFLDADDVFLPERFENTATYFNRASDALAIYEPVRICMEVGSAQNLKEEVLPNRTLAPSEDLFRAMLEKRFRNLQLNGLTLHQDCLREVGYFRTDLFQQQDADYFRRLARARLLKVYGGDCTAPVALYRHHRSNITNRGHQQLFFSAQLEKDWYEGIRNLKGYAPTRRKLILRFGVARWKTAGWPLWAKMSMYPFLYLLAWLKIQPSFVEVPFSE